MDTCWWSAAAWSVDSSSLQSAPCGEALNAADVAVWLWLSSVIVLLCMTSLVARISASLRLSFAVDRLASATSASNCRFSCRTATRRCKTFETQLLRQSTFPSFRSMESTPERVDVDVDVERIYERRPRPLCPPRLITLQYHFLLRFFVRKLATTSDALKL